jgi:hypothetical protein
MGTLVIERPCRPAFREAAAPRTSLRRAFRALLHRIVTVTHHLLCGARGHEMVRHFEPGRLSLRCLLCGAETSGWTLAVGRAGRHPARAVSPAIPFVIGARRAVSCQAARPSRPTLQDVA